MCSVQSVSDKDQINIQEEMTTKLKISLEVLGMFVQSSFCTILQRFIFTVPPNQPGDFQVAEYAPKWVNLTWSAPSDQGSSLSHYEVTYVDDNGRGITDLAKTTNALTGGLSYGVTYRFQVVAVSVAGDVIGRSLPSDPRYFSSKQVCIMFVTQLFKRHCLS